MPPTISKNGAYLVWLLAIRRIAQPRGRSRPGRIRYSLRRRTNLNEWSLTFLWISAVLGIAVALTNCSSAPFDLHRSALPTLNIQCAESGLHGPAVLPATGTRVHASVGANSGGGGANANNWVVMDGGAPGTYQYVSCM
jgi:hypothetical protein